MEILYWILPILAVLALLPLIPIHLQYSREISHRLNFSKDLKYFKATDFPGLEMKPFEFASNRGQILKGGFYRYPQAAKDRLVIVVPGYGPGHLAYTGMIQALAQLGYEVFSFDLTGTGLSEGTSMISHAQGLHDLTFALKALFNQPTYRQKKWTVLGHSLGGYITLNSDYRGYPVDRLVSMSGFNNLVDIFRYQKEAFRRFHVYFSLYMALRYGSLAWKTSYQSVRASRIKTLIMTGENDQVVPVQQNFKIFHPLENGRVRLATLKDKAHNPYFSVRGERYFIEKLLVERPKVIATKDRPTIEAFHRQLDYSLMTENDPSVFAMIQQFIQS